MPQRHAILFYGEYLHRRIVSDNTSCKLAKPNGLGAQLPRPAPYYSPAKVARGTVSRSVGSYGAVFDSADGSLHSLWKIVNSPSVNLNLMSCSAQAERRVLICDEQEGVRPDAQAPPAYSHDEVEQPSWVSAGEEYREPSEDHGEDS